MVYKTIIEPREKYNYLDNYIFVWIEDRGSFGQLLTKKKHFKSFSFKRKINSQFSFEGV